MSSVPSSLHIGDTLSAARAALRPQTASASANTGTPRSLSVKPFYLLPLLALLSIASLPAQAQSPSQAANTVPALLLSDIHLDPFHDPAKFAALRVAPATGWAAILYGPASSTQATDFAHLQETCGDRGIDSPPALLQS